MTFLARAVTSCLRTARRRALLFPPSSTTTLSASAVSATAAGQSVVVGAVSSRRYTSHSQLPEEHKMIYEMCRSFADAELAPNAGTSESARMCVYACAIAGLVCLCVGPLRRIVYI